MNVDTNKTLCENLLATASRRADHPALTFLDAGLRPTTYTFARLFAGAEAIAERLRGLGLGRAAPLGMLLDAQEAQVLHYLGAVLAGLTPAILTPPNRKLNRAYYLATMRAVVEYCRFAAVVSDVEGFEADVMTLEPHTLQRTRRGPAPTNNTPCEGAFLQFSSGTTGVKKGVLVDDRAVLRQIEIYASAIALSQVDRIVSWLPLYHDMGFITALNMPLVAGVHCVMLHPLDWVANPGLYLRAISQYRGTLGWNPNFAYAFLADRVRDRELPELDLSSLRGLVNCSEPVTCESQRRFAERFAACGLRRDVFWGCYAMAETTFALTHGESSDADYLDHIGPREGLAKSAMLPLVSVGRPLGGVALRVVDDRGQALPERALGELWVRAPFNLTEYYQNPAATRAAMVDGWYKTGDLGYRIGEAFFVIGRKKDMLIVGGVNVYPQDIEERVSQVAGVLPGRVAAFAEFDPRAQTQRVVVLAESSASPDEQVELVVTIRQVILAALQIANFEVHLVGPGWLIKSSAGKMARQANRQKWADEQAAIASGTTS